MISVLIISLLVGGGIAAYNDFNDKQKVIAAGKEYSIILRSAQKRIKSGEKPDSGCGQLYGYRITTISSGTTASVDIICDQGSTIIADDVYALSSGTIFLSDSVIIFKTLSQGVEGAQIVELGDINGNYIYQIEITGEGSITDVGII